MSKGLIGGVGLAVLIAGGLFVGIKCTEKIPAGYVGIVYNSMNGGLMEKLSHRDGILWLQQKK